MQLGYSITLSSLHYKSISSGSKGNCSILWDDSDLILIDLGISYRKFRNSVSAKWAEGLRMSLFISHEHSDHCSGVRTFCSRESADVYATRGTGDAMGLPYYAAEREVTIGNFSILPVSVSHDAADPVAFVIRNGSAKVSVVTDLGIVSPTLVSAIRGSDILAVEANHDVEMLKTGPYDAVLKRRILSDVGHLSNEQSADLLSQTSAENSRIVLLHLSENNNTPEIAFNHVESSLVNRGIQYASLECASQETGSSLCELRQ